MELGLGLLRGRGEQADALLDRRLWHGGEAEDEARWPDWLEAMQRQSLDAHAAGGGGTDQGGLVDPHRQLGQLVEPSGALLYPRLGQVTLERLQQRLATSLIAQPHPPQVAVELTARDEVVQGELARRPRAAVLDRLVRDQRPAQP